MRLDFCRVSGSAVAADACKLSCEEMVYSMSVAIDIGLLTPEELQQMCLDQDDFMGLPGKVMSFSCEEAQDDSCCISAGTEDELFRPTDEDTCNSLDGCGVMELCRAKPMSDLVSDPLAVDLKDQNFVCHSLGGNNRGSCRAIKWRGESLCETVPVCSKEEDEGEAFCSQIAQDVATCADGSAEGSEELIDCLMGLCTEDDRCYNTVDGISAQVESGWSLVDIDIESAVKAFCRWSSLAPVLDEVLNCDDDTEPCDWNVPRALIPQNPFTRRMCTEDDHCCVGDWQMGPSMCEDSPGCTFRGNSATGSCNVDASCSACNQCNATLSALPPGTSAAGYLAACEESQRAGGDDSYYCGLLEDWEEWLTRTTVGDRLPNYMAACYRLGFCKGSSCLGSSLCPAEEEALSPVDNSIRDGYCRTRQDCSGSDDRCLPFDDTDPNQQCVEQFTCDDDTGFFYARCLGTCVSKSEAACAIFSQSRVDGLMDLLYKYRSADAEGIEVEYEIAISGATELAAEQAAEAALVGRIEQIATDLETTVCYSPDDCTSGETCQQDQGCNIFNKKCTETGVIDLCVPPPPAALCFSTFKRRLPANTVSYVSRAAGFFFCRDPTVVCLGFCTITGPLTLLGQDILAQFTADGQYISVELPSDVRPLTSVNAPCHIVVSGAGLML